ncbi:DUF4376 domain-containing protein [Gallibacterium anatis]|uniref:DUF4376 domain-containing protein n=1 Tax=Gallibacterium anatis TaxID=750 RepID=UPI000692238C|nr:DUF4376 domain-containing protein [Gallibacterium anatis]
MMLFSLNDYCFRDVVEPIPDGCYLIETQEEINAISESITGGGIVWVESGKLRWSGKAPSFSHIWQDGKWVLDESKQAELLAQQRNQIRTQINAKRDGCVNGGVYVPAIQKWVDTDEKGRATLVEIKADFDLNGKEDNGEPRIFTLICADNTAEPLDFDKFKAVWNAVKNLKEKMFENAYMHKVLLEAEENPTEYDWSIGWSETYEEHNNAQEK